MTLNVTYDVKTADGTAPMQRTRALPTLPADNAPWKRPFVDRIGGVISADTPLVAGAGIVGTVVGAALTRQAGAGIFKSLLGGGGGALIGVAATIGAGIFLHRHADDQTKPPAGQVAPSTTIHGTEHVKVMTYNLHGGMGGPGKMYTNSKELDALAATIKREQPDVVIVQESDSGALRSSFTDTLSELSSRLHPESAVEAAPAVYGYGRQQFSGVMTFNNFHVDNARELISADPAGSGIMRRIKGTMEDARKVINSTFHKDLKSGKTPSYIPRGTIDTIVRTPGGNDIRVAGGHYNGPTSKYDYPGLSSIPAARALGAWNGATIFGADFNVNSDSQDGHKIAAAFTGSGLTDAFTSAGIKPGDSVRESLPDSKNDIDRIFATNQFHVDDVHVVRETGATASDHRPVVASFTLSGQPDS